MTLKNIGFKALNEIIARDEEKRGKVENSGNTMIIVPFCELDSDLPKWEFTWDSFVEIATLQGMSVN